MLTKSSCWQVYKDYAKSRCSYQMFFLSAEKADAPTIRSIMHLYGSLRSDISVKDLCLRFDPRALTIDERLVIFLSLIVPMLEWKASFEIHQVRRLVFDNYQ